MIYAVMSSLNFLVVRRQKCVWPPLAVWDWMWVCLIWSVEAVQSVRCELLPCHRQTGAGQGTGAAQPGPELPSTTLERSIAHLLLSPHRGGWWEERSVKEVTGMLLEMLVVFCWSVLVCLARVRQWGSWRLAFSSWYLCDKNYFSALSRQAFTWTSNLTSQSKNEYMNFYFLLVTLRSV